MEKAWGIWFIVYLVLLGLKIHHGASLNRKVSFKLRVIFAWKWTCPYTEIHVCNKLLFFPRRLPYLAGSLSTTGCFCYVVLNFPSSKELCQDKFILNKFIELKYKDPWVKIATVNIFTISFKISKSLENREE